MKKSFANFLQDPSFIFQAFSTNTNDYMYLWDFKSGNYIVSDNLANDFHVPVEGDDFIKVWKTFIHDGDIDRINETLTQAIQQHRSKVHMEYQVLNAQGELLWLRDISTIRYDDLNSVMIGVMHNLSFDGEVDPITGLLKHNKCKQLFTMCQESNTPVQGSLMMLGIDEFASVNTLHNHAFGDMVLRATAQNIINELPENAVMYRYDGDQFIIDGVRIGYEKMHELYYKIKDCIAKPQHILDKSYHFTLSAGIVSYPDDGTAWVDLEKALSIALKAAKEAGKNRVVHFTAEMYEEKMYEESLLHDLADSIENHCVGFKAVFQPVCFAQSLKVKGAEILLRFVTPSGEFVRPDRFIPLLEQSQLMIPAGLWVLEKAIQTCKEWSRYIEDFVMNVNVSYVQLQDRTFCDSLDALLKKYHLDVSSLIVELTESYFGTDTEAINRSLNRLQDMHIRIAMDDFGTGYSSLARLSQFNVNVVKIDRSFVQSLHNSKYNRDFVDSVVRLCHNVGMKVCVEGVETRAEQESICLLNPDYVQGYYVSRPIDENIFFNSYVLNPNVNDHLVVIPNSQLRHDQLIGDKDVLTAMMDATPLGLNFWNHDFEIIACNAAILQLFEAEDFKALKENFHRYSPTFQPDGTRSRDKEKHVIQQAFNEGMVRMYWEHQDAHGNLIPCEVTLVRIPYIGDYIVASYTRDMREQRMMETRIEAFNLRLKAILNSCPLCLNLWNRNLENTLCNKAAVALFDLDNQDDYLNNFFQLSPEYQPNGRLSNELAAECIKIAFETGFIQFEWMHCKLNGELIPAEITLVRVEGLEDDGGDLVAGYTRDLREQKMMEGKIEVFNGQLKAILDSSPLCLNLWNKRFENIMCNRAAVTLFDLDNQDQYLENFMKLSPEYQPDGMLSSEKSKAFIVEAFEKGYKQFNWMHCKEDGELIPAEITLVRIEGIGENGGDLVAGYTRDIRTQIEAQKLQEIANSRIQAVLDATPLTCILWSMDFEMLDCNTVALKMFGVNDKATLEKEFDSFMPILQPNGENSILKKQKLFNEISKKEELTFEWVYLNKKKEKIPCEVKIVRIPLEKEDIIVAYSRDLRELRNTVEMNDRLSKLAYYDLLTGITSRTKLTEGLEYIFTAKHEANDVVLIIFDIDYFKVVNDTYGHEAGDMVLKKVSKAISQLLPDSSLFGRYGGDEFLILLEGIQRIDIESLLQRLIDSIAGITFDYEGKVFHTSISMGASYLTPQDKTYQKFLKRADKALYKSKSKGRNQYTII